MQTWQLQAGDTAVPLHDVTALLASTLSPHPAQGWLAMLSRAAPVDYLCVVEYAQPCAARPAPPRLLEGWAAPGVDNVTADCFSLYRQRHWRDDEATRLAQYGRPHGALTALYCHASELQEPWRREVYEPAGLDGRLSLLYQPAAQATAVLNLYRRRCRGSFGTGEVERLLQVAPLIQLAHGLLAAQPRAVPGRASAEAIAQAGRRLRLRVPELSPRETEVCARIACGITRDGIAAELDIAPASVATLRKRAYAKLAARGVAGGREPLARLVQ